MDYDAWLTNDEPSPECACGSVIRYPGATGDLCSRCHDARKAEAEGLD